MNIEKFVGKLVAIYLGFLFFGGTFFSSVLAADFDVQGKLYFADGDFQEVSANNIHVWSYKIGESVKYEAKINKDGRGQVSFDIPFSGIKKNDQLMILAEVLQENGLFGGISTVITDENIQSGNIANQVIHLNYIPTPEFDSTDSEQIKICWKGMDDFSVVSYEVLRANEVLGDYESVGRAGQTAGRQVCFIDKEVKKSETYYYKISTLSSWNAGTGNEFMQSEAMSGASDGVMLVKGVVEAINEKPIASSNEEDMTLVANATANNQINKNQFDKLMDRIQYEIELRGWSYQVVLLIAIGIVLLVIVLFFVLSVEMSNIRSSGSDVWQRKKIVSMSTVRKTNAGKSQKNIK